MTKEQFEALKAGDRVKTNHLPQSKVARVVGFRSEQGVDYPLIKFSDGEALVPLFQQHAIRDYEVV